MSWNASNKERELTTNELLEEIIMRLDILIRHNEEITDEIFIEEDLDDDSK